MSLGPSPDGSPVAGATVSTFSGMDYREVLLGAFPLTRTTTGSDGTFSLRWTGPLGLALLAMADGFGPAMALSPRPDASGELVLHLSEPAAVEARCADCRAGKHWIEVRDGVEVVHRAPLLAEPSPAGLR